MCLYCNKCTVAGNIITRMILNSLSAGMALPVITPAQLDVGVKCNDYHTSQFGYSKPNVEFRKGYIERLNEAGIEDESLDIVMCVPT